MKSPGLVGVLQQCHGRMEQILPDGGCPDTLLSVCLTLTGPLPVAFVVLPNFTEVQYRNNGASKHALMMWFSCCYRQCMPPADVEMQRRAPGGVCGF